MQKILSTDNLSKKYGAVQALNGLTINMHKGDVYGILGPNGSGKTTTLGIVLGVTNATSGEYSWFEEGSSHELRKRIGAFLDKPNFYPHLNAIQNLNLVADIKDLKKPGIGEAMEICGVSKYANRKFITYSTGMKQRLAIASAMLGIPEVLVLDEPTNGLDPEGIADVRSIITKIASEGITVLMASHLLDEVQKVCSHVGVLKAGKKLYEGHVQSLVAGSDGIEIGSNDLGKLHKVLSEYDGIDQLEKKGAVMFVQLKAGYRSAELSGYLITKGVDITHFAQKKGNLEEEFLHLLSGNGH
jgi:ABC-2 type transport system ATP-binding protein